MAVNAGAGEGEEDAHAEDDEGADAEGPGGVFVGLDGLGLDVGDFAGGVVRGVAGEEVDGEEVGEWEELYGRH